MGADCRQRRRTICDQRCDPAFMCTRVRQRRSEQRHARRHRVDGRGVGAEVRHVTGRRQRGRQPGIGDQPVGRLADPRRAAVDVGLVADLEADDALARKLGLGCARPRRRQGGGARNQVQVDDQPQLELSDDLCQQRHPARGDGIGPRGQGFAARVPERPIGRIPADPQHERSVARDVKERDRALEQAQPARVQRQRPVLRRQAQIGTRHRARGGAGGDRDGRARHARLVGISEVDVTEDRDRDERHNCDEHDRRRAARNGLPQTREGAAVPRCWTHVGQQTTPAAAAQGALKRYLTGKSSETTTPH